MAMPTKSTAPSPTPLAMRKAMGEVSAAYSSAAKTQMPHFAAIDMPSPDLISPFIFSLYVPLRSSRNAR
jgi:hypothetical protein